MPIPPTIKEAAKEESRTAAPLFDEIGAAQYETAFVGGPPDQLASLEWILSVLSLSSITRAKCLDLGSGSGRPVCLTLSGAGHDVLGVDVSEAMVAYAQEHVPLARFAQADIRNFEVDQGGKYDVVTAYFSLIAEISQRDIYEVLRKVGQEFLKPGGVFVWGTVPLPVDQVEIKWMGKTLVVSSLGKDEALEAVKTLAGLEVIEVVETTFKPKATDAGVCEEEDVWEEDHLYIWARKPVD